MILAKPHGPWKAVKGNIEKGPGGPPPRAMSTPASDFPWRWRLNRRRPMLSDTTRTYASRLLPLPPHQKVNQYGSNLIGRLFAQIKDEKCTRDRVHHRTIG